jgi:exodeoxyribonuclease VII large subunit
MATIPQAVFSVSEFIEYVNVALKREGGYAVRGEIANVKASPSGHVYFDLKDADSGKHVLQCWVWKFRLPKYRHLIENGLEVELRGEAKLWEGGKFSFIAESVVPVGEGALKKAFEELKKRLAEKGYFDVDRKRAIPKFVRVIGVVTSTHGAVIEDFRKNLGKHGFKVLVADARVEGDEAEGSIIRALEAFNRLAKPPEVIALIRGGGSLESLKAFNSEAVAEAIVASKVPVVTGIGHETDETIAGFVSDRDFSTPTAVAKFLCEEYDRLFEFVKRLGERLEVAYASLIFELRHGILSRGNYLIGAAGRVFAAFAAVEEKLSVAGNLYARTLSEMRAKVDSFDSALGFLNPEGILEKGYALVYNENSSIVRAAADVAPGDRLSIRLRKGSVKTRVEGTEA